MLPESENPYPRQRNPRACEACRTSKSRCFASDEPNICQRCSRANLGCSVRAVARPKRQKKSALAVTQALNSQTNILLDEDNSSAVYIKIKRLPPLDSRNNVTQLHMHHQEAFQQMLPTENEIHVPITPATTVQTPQSTRNNEVGFKDGPTHHSITIDQAEEILQQFHGMKSYFPFVTIPDDATVKSLSRASPFLLLAVFCAASAKDIQLVYQLDHEFKRVLSEKVICEGIKSLDFLQGLLVYIAWYPCHLRPRTQQSFMYINLALSILDDLGIGRRDSFALSLCPDNVELEGLQENDGSFTKAAQRAYLGCYYLSSAISMGFQKPNGLKYNEIMDEFGAELTRDSEVWSDTALLPLVRCQYIRERIRDSLSHLQAKGKGFDVSPFQAEMNVQAFHNEVEEWKRTVPETIKSIPYMALAERFLTINIFSHDLAFFRAIPEQRERHLNPVTLSRCLEACKKFFESLLSIPVKQAHAFTNVEWSNVIQSIIILSRLSFPLPRCPGWDVVAAREHAPLGMYLDCLCYRMQALSSVPPTELNPKTPDGPFIFRMMLESIKKSYEQRVALVTPSVAASATSGFSTSSHSSMDRLHCPMNDRNVLAYFEPLTPDLSEAFGILGMPAEGDVGAASVAKNIPVYHDLWATMTMNWSGD